MATLVRLPGWVVWVPQVKAQRVTLDHVGVPWKKPEAGVYISQELNCMVLKEKGSAILQRCQLTDSFGSWLLVFCKRRGGEGALATVSHATSGQHRANGFLAQGEGAKLVLWP
jgi:hypothetical protein